MEFMTVLNTNHSFGTYKFDDRLSQFPLMSTFWPTAAIVGTYWAIVFLGPFYMNNRKPFDLKKVLIVYNISMVIFSAYTFLEFGLAGWFTYYSFGCQPMDISERGLRMVHVSYIFYLSKLIELLDTVFFIMRKKDNQVTFLHVIHHSTLPMAWWLNIKWFPGGFGTLGSLINSWIHFVMYTYYCLSALGPQYQKYLWWKKYLTVMQMIQFVIICFHSLQLFSMPDCDYPWLLAYCDFFVAAFFLALFADFYRVSYSDTPETKDIKDKVE